MHITLGEVSHLAYMAFLHNPKIVALQWGINHAPCICIEAVKIYFTKTDMQICEHFMLFLSIQAIRAVC